MMECAEMQTDENAKEWQRSLDAAHFWQWYLKNGSQCIDAERSARLAWHAALEFGGQEPAAPEAPGQMETETTLREALVELDERLRACFGMMDDGGWYWGNPYGSIYHDGRKWESRAELDDDYKVAQWMPLPSAPGTFNDDDLGRRGHRPLAAPEQAKGDGHE